LAIGDFWHGFAGRPRFNTRTAQPRVPPANGWAGATPGFSPGRSPRNLQSRGRPENFQPQRANPFG
jgi:hypothetical protein